MSDTILTEPIVLDETGQLMLDKLDAIISALNPNAQGVSFDKTGCEIITANKVQGALTQLDASLTQLLKVVVTETATITLSANATNANISEPLPSVAGYTPLEVLTTWQSGGGSDQVVIYTAYRDGNNVKAKAHNYGSSTATLNYEFNVLYIKSEFAPT